MISQVTRIALQEHISQGEEIIKAQHNCIYSKRWEIKAKEYKFYLIMHEHLFVFRKPKEDENLSRISWSIKK